VDYKKFYENIQTHMEVLCTPEMREHACASVEHDLDFQIYRILVGYAEALEELKKWQEETT